MKLGFWGVIGWFLLAAGSAAYAQQDILHLKKDIDYFEKSKIGQPLDTLEGWRYGTIANLSLSQGSLQNWAAGGDPFSLSVNTIGNLYANYRKGNSRWDNAFTLAYGVQKTTSTGLRKTDDNFDLSSKYGYRFSPNWYAGAMFDLRSQFTNGYLYPKDSVISHAFAPAYALLALGFNFQHSERFSLFLSPMTSRLTIVADRRLANMGAYGVDSAVYAYHDDGTRTLIQKSKLVSYQMGAYISTQLNRAIMENVNWTTRLDLFSNYLKNPQNIKVYWTSLISMKVNRLITVTLSTELIYDDDVRIWQNKDGVYGPRTQFKEILGIGFSYTFARHPDS
ncbi:Protein of unknown function (DUF3078) [Thermoflavifilum aggregans]|uniref:DUF3078 family protein n=1 Tax=Thermoflavifilum aggregans TaxID=454188 RepID=A0A2M9CST5_9BACT|nr:DUF3078 domain-containing protein [Thermoflavifilum aggregans]PJJ74996.1 Protein of unknown function (DUF3078) [Thermoflavifilum aggregans]